MPTGFTKSTARLLSASLLFLVLCLGCESSRKLTEGGIDGLVGSEGFSVVGHIPRLQVLYADQDGLLYGIEDHFLFVSEDGGKTFSMRGMLPNVQHGFYRRVRSAIARLEPVRRFRNNRGPASIEVLSSGTILIFYDQIYRSADGGRTFEVAFDYDSLGFTGGPFSFGAGTAVGPDDVVYVGEYIVGPRPQVVHVLRGREDGTKWEIAHRFEPGETFHVHSITYDRFRDVFWIALGDRDHETALLYTEDGFTTLQRLGGGSQDWRIVQLLVTEDYLYWGSDNDTESGASIFRWRFSDETLKELQYIGKVSYYATALLDGTLVIGTTYEPISPFTLTQQPPPTTDLWVSRDGEAWKKLLELEYEPMETQWGPARARIGFPSGQPLAQLFLVPRHTLGNPFATLVIEIHNTDELSTRQTEYFDVAASSFPQGALVNQ